MVKKIFAYSYVYLILFLMYVPIFTLIVFSFTNATYIGTWNGFDLSLYQKLFESEEEYATNLDNLINLFIP